MVPVLICMSLGLIAGILLKKHTRIITHVDKAIKAAIWLLLFLLGLSIGNNQNILNNFDQLGLQAVVIALASIIGSVLMTVIAVRLFFTYENKS